MQSPCPKEDRKIGNEFPACLDTRGRQAEGATGEIFPPCGQLLPPTYTVTHAKPLWWPNLRCFPPWHVDCFTARVLSLTLEDHADRTIELEQALGICARVLTLARASVGGQFSQCDMPKTANAAHLPLSGQDNPFGPELHYRQPYQSAIGGNTRGRAKRARRIHAGRLAVPGKPAGMVITFRGT